VFEKILNTSILITSNWHVSHGQQEKLCCV